MKKNSKLVSIGAGATVFAGLIFGGATAAGAASNPISTFTQSGGLTQASVSSEDRAAAREAYLTALAANLNVDLAMLKAALTETSLATLDQAVTDGKITAEEAANIRTKVEAGESFYGLDGGIRGGHGGPGGQGGMFRGASTEDIATFLGTGEATLRSELQAGGTLATVAQAHGKSRDELKAFLTSELSASLAEKVAAGDITQAEADEKLAEGTAALDAKIDGAFAGKDMGRPGRGTPGADDDDSDTSGTPAAS